MWFWNVLASLSFVLTAVLGWVTIHTSSEPIILGQYSSTYFKLHMGIAALVVPSLLAQVNFFYRRIYNWRKEILLAFFSILLALIAVEVAIRAFDPLGVSYFHEVSRYKIDKIFDPALVYKHAPGLERIYQGVEVSFNELGLRDRKLEEKQTDEFRILLLGDSVTFGWGVAVKDTFSRKLETILASRLGRPVRTVNAGVGSYNTVQEDAFLRTQGDVIDPDVVILVYVENDIEPSSNRDIGGKSPLKAINTLLQKSWLYRLVVFAVKYASPNEPVLLNKNASGVKESMKALTSIATYCRERNIGFVTFIYRGQNESSSKSSVLSQLLSGISAIGNEYGFLVSDIGLWWGNAEMRSVTNSTVDSHPNHRGHQILAAGMADILIKHGLVSKTGLNSP
ncbi:SGNH/GDSL hydrolase family protein [Desulfobacterota bacterium AH_259_B03_O07]|nr:SGNH/GDSL hydrolase family protein [Desulfobacterota bacterium AH_259_B03_O07]